MLAIYPAPKPLSILTTLTPAEQLLSIDKSAESPPKLEPYPTLVGTAITGLSTSPPTTLASAPSIPAMTIITFAPLMSFSFANNLCIPATPTSYILSTLFPNACAVTAASSATGISDVPAVTTAIYVCVISTFFSL